MRTIKLLYTCDLCGVKDQAVQAAARGEESVVSWMTNILTPAIHRDHSNRSRNCKATSITNVKIPLVDDAQIGSVA